MTTGDQTHSVGIPNTKMMMMMMMMLMMMMMMMMMMTLRGKGDKRSNRKPISCKTWRVQGRGQGRMPMQYVGQGRGS